MGKRKIVALFFLSLVLLVIIFIPGYLKIRGLARKNRELESEIEAITQANKRLKEEQERLVNDPIYLEEVARRKLGVAREGEVVYKVLPQQQNQ